MTACGVLLAFVLQSHGEAAKHPARRTARRRAYVDTMLAFREQKPATYMHELSFNPQADAGDPDVALVSTDHLAAAAKEGKTTIPVE